VTFTLNALTSSVYKITRRRVRANGAAEGDEIVELGSAAAQRTPRRVPRSTRATVARCPLECRCATDRQTAILEVQPIADEIDSAWPGAPCRLRNQLLAGDAGRGAPPTAGL